MAAVSEIKHLKKCGKKVEPHRRRRVRDETAGEDGEGGKVIYRFHDAQVLFIYYFSGNSRRALYTYHSTRCVYICNRAVIKVPRINPIKLYGTVNEV